METRSSETRAATVFVDMHCGASSCLPLTFVSYFLLPLWPSLTITVSIRLLVLKRQLLLQSPEFASQTARTFILTLRSAFLTDQGLRY